MCTGACNLTYPAYNTHELCYIVICVTPVWLQEIFRRYIANCTIFGKKYWFFLQILSKIFVVLKIIQRDILINAECLHVKYPLLFSDINETWIFSTGFREKSLNIKIYQKPSIGSRVVSCGWRDGWTDVTKLIVAFCDFANAPKNIYFSLSASQTYLTHKQIFGECNSRVFTLHHSANIPVMWVLFLVFFSPSNQKTG